MNVAVDLDGVLAQYDGWDVHGLDNIGPPVEGAKEFLLALLDDGFKVVVYTTRTNPDPFNDGEYREAPEKLAGRVRAWLREHDMWHDGVSVFQGRGKPIAFAYIDDRAVPCQAEKGRTEFIAALEHTRALYRQRLD